MVNSGFQVSLNINGRSCVVIGGDEGAFEKVERLLDAGAKVTVVHPTLHTSLRKLTASARIIHRGRMFRSSDAQGVFLILNLLQGDDDLAKSLFEQAKNERFLLWSVDRPEFSTLMMPALVKMGHLRLAISTSGTSPALARRIREESEVIFNDEFKQFLDWLAVLREEVRKTELSVERRRARLQEAVDGFGLKGEITYSQAWLAERENQGAQKEKEA